MVADDVVLRRADATVLSWLPARRGGRDRAAAARGGYRIELPAGPC